MPEYGEESYTCRIGGKLKFQEEALCYVAHSRRLRRQQEAQQRHGYSPRPRAPPMRGGGTGEAEASPSAPAPAPASEAGAGASLGAESAAAAAAAPAEAAGAPEPAGAAAEGASEAEDVEMEEEEVVSSAAESEEAEEASRTEPRQEKREVLAKEQAQEQAQAEQEQEQAQSEEEHEQMEQEQERESESQSLEQSESTGSASADRRSQGESEPVVERESVVERQSDGSEAKEFKKNGAEEDFARDERGGREEHDRGISPGLSSAGSSAARGSAGDAEEGADDAAGASRDVRPAVDASGSDVKEAGSSDGEVRGSGPLSGSLRLAGAAGEPSWLEAAIATWRELAHADEKDRNAFSVKDLVDFAKEHAHVLCWPYVGQDDLPRQIGRAVKHGKIKGGLAFIGLAGVVPGEGLYLLDDALGHGIACNRYVTDVSVLARPPQPPRASSRPPAGGNSKRADGRDASVDKTARALKRRRQRKAVPVAPDEENAAMEAAQADVVPARIPPEWTTVPPGPVRLSTMDKAPGLEIVDNVVGNGVVGPGLTVRGHKGYRMVRATHGVSEGDWYFEASILPTSEEPGGKKSAVRLGWSSRRSDIETPVGADASGFGYRDVCGDFVHNSILDSYGEAFGPGDVIGCRLVLPIKLTAGMRAKIQEADEAWLRYRLIYFSLGKAPADSGINVAGAYVEFFKNGVSQGTPTPFLGAESDGGNQERGKLAGGIPADKYFPSIALFRNSLVKVNFGPDFKYDFPEGSRPFSSSAPPPVPPPALPTEEELPKLSPGEREALDQTRRLHSDDSSHLGPVLDDDRASRGDGARAAAGDVAAEKCMQSGGEARDSEKEGRHE